MFDIHMLGAVLESFKSSRGVPVLNNDILTQNRIFLPFWKPNADYYQLYYPNKRNYLISIVLFTVVST